MYKEIVIISTVIIAVLQSIFNQIDCFKKKDYNSNLKFIISIIFSIFSIFILKSTSIVKIDFVQKLNIYDQIIAGILLGLMTTGTFDGMKEIFEKIGGN